MHRSATSQSSRNRISTPLPIEEIENRKNLLLSRKISRISQKYNSDAKDIGTPFQETGFSSLRQNIIERIKSSNQIKNRFINQNFVDEKWANDSPKRQTVPLHLLRMGNLSKKLTEENQNFASLRKKQFLRKGSAINRAIMFNVLKSKCNKKIVDSSSSFVNTHQNTHLASAIYDQVPKGLRDVIGAQQMLRMSNIFTGGTISNINLHQKVNQIIRKYQNEKKKQEIAQQQQGMTLKSIKRW